MNVASYCASCHRMMSHEYPIIWKDDKPYCQRCDMLLRRKARYSAIHAESIQRDNPALENPTSGKPDTSTSKETK